MYIPESTNLQMWQLRNMGLRPTAKPHVRRYMAGLSEVDDITTAASLLDETPVYAEARKKNAELTQQILILDYNITLLPVSDMSSADKSKWAKTFADQKAVAVADQKKIQKAIVDLHIAAAKDVKEMDTTELTTYRKQLSARYSLLKKTRAEAAAYEQTPEVVKKLAEIDAQIVKIKAQMTAAGATSFSVLSGLDANFFQKLATSIRRVTKKLPGAKFISDKVSPVLFSPIVLATGNKKQKKLAKKALIATVAVVVIVVSAVVLAPMLLPAAGATATAAPVATTGGTGLWGMISGGAGALGGVIKKLPSGAGSKIKDLLKKGMTKDNLKKLQDAIAGKPNDSAPQDTATDGSLVQYNPKQGMSTNMKIGLAVGGVGVLALAGLAIFALRK